MHWILGECFVCYFCKKKKFVRDFFILEYPLLEYKLI
jgi:hypothetical protein